MELGKQFMQQHSVWCCWCTGWWQWGMAVNGGFQRCVAGLSSYWQCSGVCHR